MSLFGSAKVKPAIHAPGSVTWPFRLGDEVEDTINGFKGVAIGRIFHIAGCDRFIVEPPMADGKVGDEYHCDGGRLKLVTSHPDRHIDETPDFGVALGDKARSLALGVTGTVTAIHVPLFGGPMCDIRPAFDEKTKKLPTGYFVDCSFVEVLEPYTPAPPKAAEPVAAPAAPPAPPKRGGMGTSSRRAC